MIIGDWLSGRFYKPLGAGESTFQKGSGSYGGSGYRSSFSDSKEMYGGEKNVSGSVKCFNCGGTGHRSSECRKPSESGSRPGLGGYTPRPVTC